MQPTLLIVDDEADILSMLRDYFEMEGYRVVTASSGQQALRRAEQGPDLILLDVGLPDIDGLTICKRIREHIACPIVFVTARVEESDMLRGLGVGGDDYVVKPFSIEQLGARVKAHLRREARRAQSTRVRFDGDLTVDYASRCAYAKGAPIPLAKKEFDILALLTENAGQVFDRERIYEAVWGYDAEGDSGVIPEHIRRLRQKLAQAGCSARIETVWGVGYKWVK